MKNMFSAGELAHYQNISKQTLLFYDKIGLFKPSFVDPENGYRYYGAEQLDYLDTILIMKKIGFPLAEIREHMKSYTTRDSLQFLGHQIQVLDDKIRELSLIKNRLEHRCRQVDAALSKAETRPFLAESRAMDLLYQEVEPPFGVKEVSLATKKCYAQALSQDLPIFFQCGVSVPLEKIRNQEFEAADLAFVTTENIPKIDNLLELPAGLTACIYHFGNYASIGRSYTELLGFCQENNLEILSDSYEFCINDYITSRFEDEFITKIIFYVRQRS